MYTGGTTPFISYIYLYPEIFSAESEISCICKVEVIA